MRENQLLHPHGELTGNEVMMDYLDDNLRRLKRDLTDIDPNCLHWQPDDAANSIAVTLWHMGRILDVFLTNIPWDSHQIKSVGSQVVGPKKQDTIRAVSVEMAGDPLTITHWKKLLPCLNSAWNC